MMGNEQVRITGKSSIVTCCTRLAGSCVSPLMFAVWKEVEISEKESLLKSLFSFLDHSDQTLRGQASLFVSEVVVAYLKLDSSSIPAIDVPSLIGKLLHLLHTDGSSITAKMVFFFFSLL